MQQTNTGALSPLAFRRQSACHDLVVPDLAAIKHPALPQVNWDPTRCETLL
jgi:hypothetical protein